MLYPKTGLKALMRLEISFFVIQLIFSEKARLSFGFVSPQFIHFAQLI
jgi:hypothetical protein